MRIVEQMRGFARRFGKELVVDGERWRYYRLGNGAPVLWLTGGLRRASFAFAFLERLATGRTVIAPDFLPVRTIREFFGAYDAILRTERIDTFALVGQSYGGFLAQAYLAHEPRAVERLVLSSSGPADYGKAWVPAEYLAIALSRALPERFLKDLLVKGAMKILSAPDAERAGWREAVDAVLRDELSRADVLSHFAVAADVIRSGIIDPRAYRNWTGRVVVLSAENDPTQSKSALPRYERLFGRVVDVLSMGQMGHTAALFDPDRYVGLLEQALG